MTRPAIHPHRTGATRRLSRRSRMDASVIALVALALTAVTLPIVVFALIPGLLIVKLARMQD